MLNKSVFAEYDTFDVACALYHWLQHNWGGSYGGDPLYAAYCELTAPGMYRPSRSEEFFDKVDDTVKEVYSALTEDNYQEALAQVLNYESEAL